MLLVLRRVLGLEVGVLGLGFGGVFMGWDGMGLGVLICWIMGLSFFLSCVVLSRLGVGARGLVLELRGFGSYGGVRW